MSQITKLQKIPQCRTTNYPPWIFQTVAILLQAHPQVVKFHQY